MSFLLSPYSNAVVGGGGGGGAVPTVNFVIRSKVVDPTNPFPAGSDLWTRWNTIGTGGDLTRDWVYVKVDITSPSARQFKLASIHWGQNATISQPYGVLWSDTTQIVGGVNSVIIEGPSFGGYNVNLTLANQYPATSGSGDQEFINQAVSADDLRASPVLFDMNAGGRIILHWFYDQTVDNGAFPAGYAGYASLYDEIQSFTNTIDIQDASGTHIGTATAVYA